MVYIIYGIPMVYIQSIKLVTYPYSESVKVTTRIWKRNKINSVKCFTFICPFNFLLLQVPDKQG